MRAQKVNLLFTGIVFALFVALASKSFAYTTKDCKIDVSKLQPCPSKNARLVPKNYQPQILFIKDQEIVSNVEFLETLPEGTMVSVDGSGRDRLRESLAKKYPPAKVAELEKKILFYPHPHLEREDKQGLMPIVDNENGGYIRDLAVLGFDPATGTIQYNYQKRDWHPDGDELEICGLKAQMNDLGSGFFNPGVNRGGNVMALPGGQCLVGENMIPDRALTLCGQGEGVQIIKLPTLGTTVGHIDELVNIIPSPRPAPCNFHIVIADQKTHDQVLKDNPKELFFREKLVSSYKNSLDEYYSDPNKCQMNGCPAKLPQERVCELYKARETLLYFQSKLTSEMIKGAPTKQRSRSRDKASLLLDLFISPGYAGGKSLQKITPEEKEAEIKKMKAKELAISNYGLEYNDEIQNEMGRKMKRCSELTNEDVLTVMNESDYSQIKAFIENQDKDPQNSEVPVHRLIKDALYNIEGNQKANQEIAESLDKTRSILEQNIPAECKESAFVKLPYLFIDAKAVNPNPANVLAAGKAVITPKQITPAVGKYIKDKYEELGLKSFEMNTFSKHTGGGNVHCLTNEMRLCAP